MQQDVRFCAVDGARVAYAVVGEGPPLVLPALWISDLELEWSFAPYRAFVGSLAAGGRTVVRYDRPGVGVSDRDGVPTPSVDGEVRVLEAVVEAAGLEELGLLGISRGGCTAMAYAARHPGRVTDLALFGSFADGSALAPPDLRDALLAAVRAHWGSGSRILADVWLPSGTAEDRASFAALQREAAEGDAAADALAEVYAVDVRDVLQDIACPTVVLHRRDDRAVPLAAGRDVAAGIPGARMVVLDGDDHPPWVGDADAVLAHLRNAAAVPVLGERDEGTGPSSHGELLTAREQEVLALVAEGLSDADIAERLVVSPHTVHRHVANIRTKLGQPSRAAAVAYAARLGLI